jgi:hypothetical protein
MTFLFVAFDGVTVATNCSDPPISNDIDDLFKLTPVTVIGFTVTEHVAVFPPSSVVAVIFAEPTPMPVTLPFESTVATPVLELDQDTFLFAAFSGRTVAVKEEVSPIFNVIDSLSKLTELTLTGLTVTEQLADLPPSSVVTVITVFPVAIASTRPDGEMVATDGSLDFHVTSLIEALEGEITNVNDAFSPSIKDNSVGEMETDSMAMYFPFLPSWVTEISFVSD